MDSIFKGGRGSHSPLTNTGTLTICSKVVRALAEGSGLTYHLRARQAANCQ